MPTLGQPFSRLRPCFPTPAGPLQAYGFALRDVRLLDSPFKAKAAMRRNEQYLLSLEPDRLLHRFRLNAGLPPDTPTPRRCVGRGRNCQSKGYQEVVSLYLSLMKLALELEVPEGQAAAALQWLQNIPAGLVAKFRGGQLLPGAAPLPGAAEADEELPEAEQHRLLHEVFGSWKSEESGDEMVRRIYADRQDLPREVNL